MAESVPGWTTALGDRYRVERELGRGGMATVYLARDLRHDRPVALKVLFPELAATLGPDRFAREIRLAARLQHPHICGVLDSGEVQADGVTQLWFTMPFVEGESLRAEALDVSEKAILFSPEHPAPRQTKAMIYLAQGDLAAAQQVVSEAGPTDPTAMVVYMAQYWDLYWALDDQQQQLVLRLPVGTFDGDEFGRAMVFAELYGLRGDAARSRAYADTAAAAAAALTSDAPTDPYLLAQQSMALAYQGRKSEAMKVADQSLSIQTSGDDAYSGTYNEHLAARVYLRSGKPEKTLDILERLVKIPYYLSPGWLRIDPEWRPLHGNPRFEKLIAGTS